MAIIVGSHWMNRNVRMGGRGVGGSRGMPHRLQAPEPERHDPWRLGPDRAERRGSGPIVAGSVVLFGPIAVTGAEPDGPDTNKRLVRMLNT
jgi:hypothetical protein